MTGKNSFRALEAHFATKGERIQAALDRLLPAEEIPPALIHKAMRYSVFAGGKRIRPVLTLTASEIFGGNEDEAMPAACALECIHTYSLIHDDLPCMDDDDLRRGKPTSHKMFGEAIAVLAGDALLTHAFTILAGYPGGGSADHKKLRVIDIISRAAGTMGMLGGQVLDIQAESKPGSEDLLQQLHAMKTAALLSAAAAAGAVLSPASEEEVDIMARYGRLAGLAFQMVDDILDVEGDENKLGKTKGKDMRDGKLTCVSVYGLAESKRRASGLADEIVAAVAPLGRRAEILRDLALYIVQRAF
jgi:geranylgeranyl diphosphate synthase type II